MPTLSPSESQGDYYSKHFGVRADLTTDDVPAIQAAISACVAGNGGRVILPPGTVGCGTTLLLPSNVELVIPTNCTFKALASLTADMIQNADQTNGNTGVRISGGGIIDGNQANVTAPAGRCISFKKCDDAQIEEVIVQNAYTDGVFLDTCKRTVIDVTALSNGRDGARLSTVTFAGGRLHAVNNGARVTGNGLTLTTAATDCSLIVLATDTQGSPTQQYGIQETTANCNRNVFVGSCNGNVVAGSSFLGASSQLFTQPSMASPAITGTVSGGATYTAPTLSSAILTGTTVTPSAAGSSGLAGTALTLTLGAGDGVGAGGATVITAGLGGATGAGGATTLASGQGGATSGGGGALNLQSGSAGGSGTGGTINATAGNGVGSGLGGPITLIAGNGGISAAVGAAGGITLFGGNAGAASNSHGGRIRFTPGNADGTGLVPLVEVYALGGVPTTAVMTNGTIGFRMNGNVLSVYSNVSGSIKTLSIGTLA